MSDEGPFNEVLASRVARLMEATGFSGEEVADRALLEYDQVERVLAGTEPIGIDTVILLAGALGVPVQELLEGVEWAPDGQGGGSYRAVDLDD